MTTPIIRPAKPEDLPILNTLMFQLHEFHYKSQPEHFKTPQEIELEKSISTYLDDPDCLVYVAETKQNNIAGFITGHFCELVSVVSKPVPMGSIDELYVLPAFREQGIAELLFRKLEQMLEDYGVEQIFVEVWDFNRSAQSFYQKMAFEHHIHWLRKPVNQSGS